MAVSQLESDQDCIVLVDAGGVELCRLMMCGAPFLSCNTARKLATAAASECSKSVGPGSCQSNELGSGGSSCAPTAGSADVCSLPYPGMGGYALNKGEDTCLGGVGIFGKSPLSERDRVMQSIEDRLMQQP